ncbi:MAG: winged helix-turn-helix transcriptional regulator [Desulfobacteraceae bacterium]|nr:winged helix-turn-helix transcriptional regulator [Desulfobacteraceae bacterium]
MKTCKQKTNKKKYYCYFELTLQVIGGKWKSIILYHLGNEKVLRFGELKKAMPNITEKMLIQQLRELEADELVHRKVYKQVPPKVEYSLTEFGETILPTLQQLKEWGIQYEQRFGLDGPYKDNSDYEQQNDYSDSQNKVPKNMID